MLKKGEEINFIEKTVFGKDLKVGFHGEHVSFSWRPYEQRSPDHQEDHDRLKESLLKDGMKNPLITFNNHILVGMRRHEILMRYKVLPKFLVWEIQEDVNEWTKEDLKKLDFLQSLMTKVKY